MLQLGILIRKPKFECQSLSYKQDNRAYILCNENTACALCLSWFIIPVKVFIQADFCIW